ncbi:MAG: cytochrome c [bacterium]|nr:cytochrome c [bacterium]
MERLTKIGLAGLALVLALGACSKSSDSSSTTASATAAATAAASTAATEAASPAASSAMVAQNGAAAADGAKVYETNCSSCHQAQGTGLAGSFPPLAGNPVVTGDAKQVIHILKYGLNGKIQVAGHTYNGMMPAWGQSLSNADIAAVVTYIRSSWGNKASAVTEADVAGVAQ